MRVEETIEYLRSAAIRPLVPEPEIVKRALIDVKQQAVARGDEIEAKRLWCLQQVLRAQNLYLQAFSRLKRGDYYAAWCDLEQVAITLSFLERHDTGSWSEFGLDFVRIHTAKWQSLYPYKLFISPEMIERAVCSICREPLAPRKPCGHTVGEIYNGEMCGRVVIEIDQGLGMALVTNPAQKYSVPFTTDPDTGESRDEYNYGVLKYAVSALSAPFDAWDVERTTRRQPHSRFTDVGRYDPCPCESGKTYEKCCRQEEGVLRPHLEFSFAEPPPPGVPVQSYA